MRMFAVESYTAGAVFSGAAPVRQDGLDFELCRSVCDAAETEQGGEEAFHLFVVWTQR